MLHVSQLCSVLVYISEPSDDIGSKAYSVQAPHFAFISFFLFLLRALATLSTFQCLEPKMLSVISYSHKILIPLPIKISLHCPEHPCVTHTLRLPHLCSLWQVSVYMLFPLAAF